MSDTGGLGGDPCGDLGLDGSRPRRPLRESVRTTSLTIPTCRHFWNRQNWHRFRLRLSTGQFFSARQTYLELFCTVLLKNPKKHQSNVLLTLDVSIAIFIVGVQCRGVFINGPLSHHKRKLRPNYLIRNIIYTL